jgi:hypothetical protein
MTPTIAGVAVEPIWKELYEAARAAQRPREINAGLLRAEGRDHGMAHARVVDLGRALRLLLLANRLSRLSIFGLSRIATMS